MTPEEIKLLSELTIVIPTYNRPLELERSIEYWRDTPVTVHILDGSENPCFNLGSLPGIPNVTYHYMPAKHGEKPSQNYARRLIFGTSLPTTKYSSLLAVDDCMTISGLCEVLAELNNDSRLDAMIGRAALYDISKENPIWQLRYADLRNSEDYRSKNVATRLLNPDRAPWLYYGVVKTNLWAKLFQISFKYDISKTEALMAIVDKALCRIQILEKIVWVRQGYVPRIGMDSIYYEPRPSLLKQIFNKNRLTERRLMRRQVKEAIKFSSPSVNKFKVWWLARKTTKPKILRRHKNFWRIKERMIRKLLRFFSFLSPEIRRKITEFLPWRISGPLGYYKIKPETLAATSRTSLDEFLILLQKSDVNFDPSELRDFENLLRKPREELRLRANI